MENIEKIKKKLKEKFEESVEMDGSDIPVHERFVKEEDIKRLKKKSK